MSAKRSGRKTSVKMNRNVKTMVLAAILVAGVALTACSKKKTCECTITVKVGGYTQTQTVTGETEGKCEDMPEAKQVAQQMNQAMAGSGSVSISCK